jgi:hypothetical protein
MVEGIGATKEQADYRDADHMCLQDNGDKDISRVE